MHLFRWFPIPIGRFRNGRNMHLPMPQRSLNLYLRDIPLQGTLSLNIEPNSKVQRGFTPFIRVLFPKTNFIDLMKRTALRSTIHQLDGINAHPDLNSQLNFYTTLINYRSYYLFYTIVTMPSASSRRQRLCESKNNAPIQGPNRYFPKIKIFLFQEINRPFSREAFKMKAIYIFKSKAKKKGLQG